MTSNLRGPLRAEQDDSADPPFPRNGIKSMKQDALLKLFALLEGQDPDWDRVAQSVAARPSDCTGQVLALVDWRARACRGPCRRMPELGGATVRVQPDAPAQTEQAQQSSGARVDAPAARAGRGARAGVHH